MPLYDYQCKKCGATFEVQATIKEKVAGLKLICPKCGSHEARQLITAVVTLHDGKEFSPPVCGPNAGPGCCGG
jgi:putative FmdB family regulatory protein